MSGERGSYARGIARRAQIIQAATELFARVGYRNATVLEIAETAGISRTGLLHHFPSKEALLEAILEKRDTEDQARLGPMDGPLSGLRNLVALARYNATVPHLVNLFTLLAAEAVDPAHPAHDYVVRRYAGAPLIMQRALTAARDAGLLAPGVDVERQARALVALMDGLQVQWLLDPAAVDMAAVLEAEIQQVLVIGLYDTTEGDR